MQSPKNQIKPTGSNAIGHTSQGTEWGQIGAKIYAETRHGPDGAKFLDPYFLPAMLESIAGQTIADIGCGAGPWAIEAAKHGAKLVEASDLQQGMLEQARTAIQNEGLSSIINLSHADAARLPYVDGTFDKAISINVGCNLPPDGFYAHFMEMYRILRPGGSAVVTAPASFGIVFTDGSMSLEASNSKVISALTELGSSTDAQSIKLVLGQLEHIFRATFVVRDGSLLHVTDESILIPGEPIWRKLPKMAVPNMYHSEAEYVAAAETAGFKLEKWHREKFGSQTARALYNDGAPGKELGHEYIENNPFAVFVLRK